MAMHQGLDLSRFKRVSSDKKSTTLRHAKGHEIKIAHSGLTPKMREHINSLPEHEDRKMYAGGSTRGRVSNEDEAPVAEEPLDPASPATAPDPAPEAPPPAAPAPTLAPEQAPAPQPEAAAPQAPAPAAPTVAPDGTVNVIGHRRPAPPTMPTPQERAAKLTAENVQFQQDLAMGHVQPQTYQELFAHKDTLGKIGTLFGLLVSGAGAGLTHQPNAVLEMMDKQIQRDFDAQKATQDNARNWRNLAQQHEMQQAQIENYGHQNQLLDAQAGQAGAGMLRQMAETNTLVPAQAEQARSAGAASRAAADLSKAESELIRTKTGLINPETGNSAIIGDATAQNNATIAALHSIELSINKLPAGPQRDASLAAFATLSQAAAAKIGARNLEAASRVDARNKLLGVSQQPEQPQEGAEDTGIDMDKYNAVIDRAQRMRMGGASKEDPEAIKKDASELQASRSAARDWVDSFNKLSRMALAGHLNPQLRAAEIDALMGKLTTVFPGPRGVTEANRLVHALFPAAGDYGEARSEKLRKGLKIFEDNESRFLDLKRLGLVTKFPKYSLESDKKKPAAKTESAAGAKGGRPLLRDLEGKIISSPSGEKFIIRNGQKVPLQQASK